MQQQHLATARGTCARALNRNAGETEGDGDKEGRGSLSGRGWRRIGITKT
jgi:hypothetical protein